MLGKRVQFSLPGITEDDTRKEGLAGMARIGAIFEGDEEEDANKSSVLSGAILYDSEGVYLRPAIASRSFTMLPNFVTDPSSGLLPDDISTAPSTEITAPMAVAGSREGSPSPSIVAQLARRSILVAELFQIRMSSSQPPFRINQPLRVVGLAGLRSRATCASNSLLVYGRGRGTTPSTQRGNSSWTKVENKLQEPAPLLDTNLEKKKGGFRKVMKKVKNAFAKGVKALA